MTHGAGLGALAATFSFLGILVVPAAAQTSGDRFLPRGNFVITSTLRIDMTKDTATLPLHKGTFNGMGVYYVITDASDQQAARTLGVNFAPRLAVITKGCPGCAETVSSTSPTLGKGEVTFTGVPDFQGSRILAPGPKGFPHAKVQPGGAGDLHYSPFVKIAGSPIVYNASVVAVGGPPYDVTKHTNTADRVLAIDTKKMTVDLLVVQAYAYGKRILYLSSEASEPLTASLERATFTPGRPRALRRRRSVPGQVGSCGNLHVRERKSSQPKPPRAGARARHLERCRRYRCELFGSSRRQRAQRRRRRAQRSRQLAGSSQRRDGASL